MKRAAEYEHLGCIPHESLGVGHYLTVEIARCKKKYLNKAFIDGPAAVPRVIMQIRCRIVRVPDKLHKKNGGYRVEEYFDGFTVPLAQ